MRQAARRAGGQALPRGQPAPLARSLPHARPAMRAPLRTCHLGDQCRHPQLAANQEGVNAEAGQEGMLLPPPLPAPAVVASGRVSTAGRRPTAAGAQAPHRVVPHLAAAPASTPAAPNSLVAKWLTRPPRTASSRRVRKRCARCSPRAYKRLLKGCGGMALRQGEGWGSLQSAAHGAGTQCNTQMQHGRSRHPSGRQLLGTLPQAVSHARRAPAPPAAQPARRG